MREHAFGRAERRMLRRGRESLFEIGDGIRYSPEVESLAGPDAVTAQLCEELCGVVGDD